MGIMASRDRYVLAPISIDSSGPTTGRHSLPVLESVFTLPTAGNKVEQTHVQSGAFLEHRDMRSVVI